MRFLSCHIAGFGKFIDRSFDLSQNIMEVKADNGWGKTTLAAFFECMLFGLEGGRSKSVADNYRVRYAPFYGGAFGGSLVFTYRGKTYRIERSFSATAGGDTVRVYDKNNIRCFDFGDKAERLGEVILGVDRESYRRTAYIPQGEIETGGLPADMRGRLLALLGSGEGGAQDGVERLEKAERALRAKRKPGKGKLDELDERMAQISRMRIECENAGREARETQETLLRVEERLAQVKEETAQVREELERLSRENDAAASRTAERQLAATRGELEELHMFFNGVDPVTVNADGLENAVNEYYAVKAEALKAEEELASIRQKSEQKENLQTALSACESSIGSYEKLLGVDKKTAKDKKKDPAAKEDKYTRKKRRNTWAWFVIAVFLAMFGATQADARPYLGYTLLAVGGVCLLISSIGILRDAGRYALPKKPLAESIREGDTEVKYAAAKAERDRILAQLAQIPSKPEEEIQALSSLAEGKRNRANALETAIKNFLVNFRFGQIYDYRAALTTLRERMDSYRKLVAREGEYEEKLASVSPQGKQGVRSAVDAFADISRYKERLRVLETEKENLIGERAALKGRVETLQDRSFEGRDYAAEEIRLKEEQTRLERRLAAVVAAKEILIGARRNIASQYLEPIERECKKYARTLGFADADKLLFSAEGDPLFDENGSIRQAEYYSEGTRGLVDFCMRLALAETLFTGEKPVLVLDDPFVDLDDGKTESAKRLVFELAKNYQIIYFTCKSERSLRK